MIVAHVSRSALGGAVWTAAEAFREAGYDSFCIAPDSCHGGRAVPTHYKAPPVGGAVARLHQADIIFCHEGWPYGERWYPRDKPTIGWYHGPAEHVDRRLERAGWPWGVAAGRRGAGYAAGRPLPELCPLEHRFYQAGEKPAERVRIACCVSDARVGGPNDCLGFVFAAVAGTDVDVIDAVPLEGQLRRIAAAHILIDGCETGSYSRRSLDGLALGCVVINACDSMRAWNIQRVTGGCGHPFELADRSRVAETLRRLVDFGPATLSHMGRRNRSWLEAAWGPRELIDRNLAPLMAAALHRGGQRGGPGDGDAPAD